MIEVQLYFTGMVICVLNEKIDQTNKYPFVSLRILVYFPK
jgi:hypothetical protein